MEQMGVGMTSDTWYLVYMNTDTQHWWNRKLQDGFQHVQLWKASRFGPEMRDMFWLVVDPDISCANAYLDHDPTPPWARSWVSSVQRVTRSVPRRKVRDYFFAGPMTCVELAKAYLGISVWSVRTPWQLHEYVHKNNYNLTTEA